MNKQEFLEALRKQLSGQMHEGKIAAHVQYYRNYIEEQVSKGRSEMEILCELGEPRLIAKTLLDTDSGSTEDIVYEQEDICYGNDQNNPAYGGRCQNVRHRSYKLDLSTWYGKVIVILIAMLVIAGLVVLIGTVLPVIIIVSAVLYVISRFRKK